MNVGKIKDMIKKAKQALSRGDTLIEVLIAIAVMAVVISGIYAIAHRNLRTAEASQQRNQALALAQGQVEFMRSAAANQSLSAYTSQAPFCINDGSVSFTDSSLTKYNGSGTAIPADTKDFSANDQKTYCLFSTNPQLYISDTYTTTGIFQVTVAYPSPTGRLTSVNSSDNYDTVQLFYRPPIYSNSDLTIGTDKPTGTIVVKGDTNGTVVNVIINRASGFSDSVDLSVSSGLPTDGRVQASFGTPNTIDSSAK